MTEEPGVVSATAADAAPVRPATYIPEGSPPPIRQTLSLAFRLIRDMPRETLLPLVVIQVPVAAVISVATVVLYLTVLDDREMLVAPELFSEAEVDQLFLYAVVAAVEGMFALVARGATIVAIAAAARGHPVSLTQALDPAFTRLGGLIVLILMLSGAAAVLFVSVIGIPILIYCALRLVPAFDVFMLEERGAFASLGRAWSLMQGNMLRLFWAVMLGLLAMAPLIIVAGVLAGATGGSRSVEIVTFGVTGLLQSIVLLPTFGFLTAVTTLFYLNIRSNEHAAATP